MTNGLGMLYAEHTLRQFNILGRAPLILKYLDQPMPDSLDDLYHIMLAELQRRIPGQHVALKSLFSWLAFSYRSLTFDECLTLLKRVPGKSLDLEEELQGQHLSR